MQHQTLPEENGNNLAMLGYLNVAYAVGDSIKNDVLDFLGDQLSTTATDLDNTYLQTH